MPLYTFRANGKIYRVRKAPTEPDDDAALAEELSRGMGPGAPPPRAADWWAIAWNSALISAAIALIAAGLACCTDVCDGTADRIAAFKV